MFNSKLISQIIKFCLVGGLNSAIDIGIYTLLTHLGLPLLVANTTSTTVAMVVSYFLNSRYTFEERHLTTQRIILFIVITATGQWVLQPLVILASTDLLQLTSLGLPKLATIIIPKMVAIAVTLLWNFVWYRLVVFKSDPQRQPTEFI